MGRLSKLCSSAGWRADWCKPEKTEARDGRYNHLSYLSKPRCGSFTFYLFLVFFISPSPLVCPYTSPKFPISFHLWPQLLMLLNSLTISHFLVTSSTTMLKRFVTYPMNSVRVQTPVFMIRPCGIVWLSCYSPPSSLTAV